ncbi:MAG: penicillin-binding protein 2 [Geminicoccaceae bacterium]|nr:MAG: penicillin-binding protein 2 [Geminicoccaceae bacterium]
MNGRILVLAACFAGVFGAVGLRLVDLGLPGNDAPAQRFVAAAPETARADLLDREGRVLATTVMAPRLVADPRHVRDVQAEAQALAAVLEGASEARLARLLGSERHHVVLAREIGPREIEAVRRLGLPAVSFEYHHVRLYPNGPLAAHVLGYVDVDNQGLSGAERAFDARLRGPDREPVRLALDLAVQMAIEEELDRAIRRHRAKAGAAMVMDARTGELVAAASLPSFDPHQPARADEDARKDLNVTQTFELGSVFKVLTVAVGLEKGAIGLHDQLDARGSLRIGRQTIGDFRPRNRVLTVPESLIHSSNIANARIGLKLGGERYREFVEAMGLTQPLVFEGGTTARPQVPGRWSDIAVATVAFGHGLAITPLHYTAAVAGMLTDGRPRTPTLLAQDAIQEPEGEPVLSPRVVEAMRGLTWRTLHDGRSQGRVEGYWVGGKTGTARKVVNGRYQTGVVRSSFVAAFPIDDPQYVVFAMLDEPKAAEGHPRDRITAGWVTAPAVSRMVARIGPILGVAPSSPDAATTLAVWSGQTPPVRAQLEGGADAAREPRG